ncbi:hypothetical protein T265_04691 [Opisthorchis viverrini]|uniref:Uncharacterized protein n=1 Tax=Opisthorchis viverrini TaxID=6198 RepID=A0A074ZRK5_OPIVI|nr:hypothetical protein T265_04691 [Opisthorchis viverrini]KER28462.1 hypothetical protein T265_04691 [Opisthorchis viverrini]
MFGEITSSKEENAVELVQHQRGNANLLTIKSVVRTRSLHLEFPCLALGNLAVSQLSCLLLVAWQLGTERTLQLNQGLGNLTVSQPSCFLRVAWQLGTERALQLNDITNQTTPSIANEEPPLLFSPTRSEYAQNQQSLFKPHQPLSLHSDLNLDRGEIVQL